MGAVGRSDNPKESGTGEKEEKTGLVTGQKRDVTETPNKKKKTHPTAPRRKDNGLGCTGCPWIGHGALTRLRKEGHGTVGICGHSWL